MRLAVHTHVSVNNTIPLNTYSPERIQESNARAALSGILEAPLTIATFLNSGVFDRVPDLRVVLAEVDGAWVPSVKQGLDNRFYRRVTGATVGLARRPSEIISEHFYYSYVTDHFAVRNRHDVGVERLMWSSDFPHTATDWPDSWRTIEADFDGVSSHERQLILAGNALRLYRFDER
jgi:predicted TIM-barrel fold metal-dependent hydrolase